jgi:hypothetical protein
MNASAPSTTFSQASELAPFEKFIDAYGRKPNGQIIAARLQAFMVLIERLLDEPSLTLADHWTAGSSGFRSHETYGKKAHDRHSLTAINRNHGRRSCNLSQWGQKLLDLVAATNFPSSTPIQREEIITAIEAVFARPLRDVIEQEPLRVRLSGRTAESIIEDLILLAEEKGKSGDVAQYLVGAKLQLRFGIEVPVHPANKSDRKSAFDSEAKLGDFEFKNAVIEVAMGQPDDKHLDQIVDALERPGLEVWLLTRGDRVGAWKNEVSHFSEADHRRRTVVTSVESFVGQNITELGEFSSTGKAEQLAALFDLYNMRWVAEVGTPGIRIEIS